MLDKAILCTNYPTPLIEYPPLLAEEIGLNPEMVYLAQLKPFLCNSGCKVLKAC